jgi:uncharacterized protein (UPF0262 family)
VSAGDHRIVAVTLDERTVLWRNADVEQERRVAIFDLLEGNSFRPLGEVFEGARGRTGCTCGWRKGGWR